MDLLDKPNLNEKSNIETSTSNEDVLVVLQTENGEQIALPMSALPSDFVPGDSGQIIMVESALDEQQQEIVVESTDIVVPEQTSSENFVSLQQAEPTITSIIPHNPTITSSPSAITTINSSNTTDTAKEQLTNVPQNTNFSNKQIQRTYSKNDVVKSYAPTCGTTRIYQQQSHNSMLTSTPNSNQTTNLVNNNESSDTNELLTIQLSDNNKVSVSLNEIQSSSSDTKQLLSNKQDEEPMSSFNEQIESQTTKLIQETSIVQERKPKQKRKETLLTRPLNEEDLKMEFQIIEEPLPSVQEVEVRKRPRKEYRTKKKVRLAMEKMSKDKSIADDSSESIESKVIEPKVSKRSDSLRKDSIKDEAKIDSSKKEDKKRDEAKKDKEKQKEKEKEKELEKERDKDKEEVKKEKEKDKVKEKEETATKKRKTPPQQQQQQQQQQPQFERRTRLSNIYKVSTGKMYKCNDCDFSTDRINNIVLHVKESCPKMHR